MTAPSTGSAPRIVPPSPGRAVLACRCGRMLALAEMRRPSRSEPRSPGSPSVVEPILCERCAEIAAR